MPRHELSLPQQFGRFLVTGALVFVLVFWGLSQILDFQPRAHLNFLALRLILKAVSINRFPSGFKIRNRYLPFFFASARLLGCYMTCFDLCLAGGVPS